MKVSLKSLVKILFFLGFFSGCASSPVSHPSSAPLTLGPGEESPAKAYEKALKAEPGTKAFEQARMEYLLERVSDSPYNFIRNNDRYTGKRAVSHLRWKRLRNLLKVKTAEDFIETVATRSKVSGQLYLVEIPGKKRGSLRRVLTDELKRFDERVEKERQKS